LGILFISHSSRDNAAALRVCDWLKQNGWGEVFLDLDPEHGLAAGQRWQQELKQAGERCSGVLVLLSPDWIASRWCQTEFLIADQLGKKIFPLFVAPTHFDDLPLELKAKFQIVDISTPEKEAEGFQRLAVGLKRSGLDPKSFPWPPPGDPYRPIYRGLESLDEQDAAIFFGRDAHITKALDTLRRMRDGAPERVLLILGASGAGKSSFLRAGLIARLKRDEENFLVLPVIRPERAALTGPHGLAASLGCDAARFEDPETMPQLLARMRERVMERLRRFAGPASDNIRPPTIVIAVDQAEEFFSGENVEAAPVLDLLVGTVQNDRNAIIVATIRSDSFAKLQGRPRLAEIALQPFSLPPIPLGAFKEVIECPPRLANPPLTVEPALIDRLLQDLAAEDALPLLALTLERLSSRHRGGGMLTLAEYIDKLGGLRGAIVGAVEAAFSEAQRDPALPQTHGELEKLARAAFIPALVHLDDADAQPTRRVEQLTALPEATRPLVRHLINQRLLVTNRSVIDGVETDTVEVTHEAILRQWPALRGWIAEERDALRTLNSVRDAAAEWHAHKNQNTSEQGQSWLVHRGGRLLEAEALLARPDFSAVFALVERDYLSACRQYENAETLREQRALARTRRLQRNIAVLIGVAAAVVLLAGIGILQLLAGITANSVKVLVQQAAKVAEESNYDQSARYALAGLEMAQWSHKGLQGNDAESELRFALSASSAIAALRGHKHQVLGANFSPDGKKIVTASRDATARIWDIRTAQTIAVLKGHKGAVYSASFSRDGKRILTSSEDKTARIWDASTGAQILVLRGHDGSVYSAAFSPDGSRIVTASVDTTARVWNSSSGALIIVLQGHTQDVESAAFSHDGKQIVTASDDKTARIWDTTTGHEIAVLRGHETIVDNAAFSPDGQFVATASVDKTVRIWAAKTGEQLEVLRGHADAVLGVAFSIDGSRLATASKDNTVRIWDVASGREEAVLRGHDDAVNGVSFSADGQRLVTASDDRTARVWDGNLHLSVLRGHEDTINGVALSRDGARVATASSDRTVRIWDRKTGHEVAVLRGHGNLVETVAFSPDGKHVVSGSDDQTARVWDAGTGRLLTTLRGGGIVYGVAFSPDGERIATASTDGLVRIWKANTGETLEVLHAHRRAVNSVQFDAKGQRIATGSDDGTAKIWDVTTGRVLVMIHGNGERVYSAAFNPDGMEIVTAGQDKSVHVWDAQTGRLRLVLSGHEDWVMSAEFSGDGKRIITASHDRTARIWDANTGSQIAVLRGHTSRLEGVAFSFDGKWAVTGSDDETARIWNVSEMVQTTREDLIRRTCEVALARGLSQFSTSDIQAVPVLDSKLDSDACHPPSLWARLARIFEAARLSS
jgi:WD40 repeat protein